MLNIKIRAANLVKKHGTADPYRIASGMNIWVFALELSPDIRGFFATILRRKYIVINASLSEAARRVVLCHELGHALLHRGYGYYYTTSKTCFISSKREAEANEFACRLLSQSFEIDPEQFTAILKDRRPDPKVVHHILSSLSS